MIVKEIQKLIGRLLALYYFISKVNNKAHTFFLCLINTNKFERKNECENAFAIIKEFLVVSSVHVQLHLGEPLILHVFVYKGAISVVLM